MGLVIRSLIEHHQFQLKSYSNQLLPLLLKKYIPKHAYIKWEQFFLSNKEWIAAAQTMSGKCAKVECPRRPLSRPLAKNDSSGRPLLRPLFLSLCFRFQRYSDRIYQKTCCSKKVLALILKFHE